MVVNFDINDIFLKIQQDKEIQQDFEKYNIIYDEEYKNEVIRRIEYIYNNNFDLYAYLMGYDLDNEILIKLSTPDLRELIKITDGVMYIKLELGDPVEEKYEINLTSLDFFSLTTEVMKGTAEFNNSNNLLLDNTKDFSNLDINNLVVYVTKGQNKNIIRNVIQVINDHKLLTEDFPNLLDNDEYKILKIPTIYDIKEFLNINIFKNSDNLITKYNILFSYIDDNLYLKFKNIDDNRKLKLTISNSDFVGTYLDSLFGFDGYGTSKTNNQNVLDTFLNDDFSGFVDQKPPWLSSYISKWNAETNVPEIQSGVGFEDDYYIINVSGIINIDETFNWYVGNTIYFRNNKWVQSPKFYNYTNYELLLFAFNLDPINDIYDIKYKICRKLLYHFKYMGVEWFFLKHYNKLLPEYDFSNIQTTKRLKTFLESLLIEMDRISQVTNNMVNVRNPDIIYEKLLDYLASNLGFEKEEYQFNNISYRELIKNLIDVYKIKGTNFSTELFFKFLGFKANVTEYWFDRREAFNKLENPLTGINNYAEFRHYLTTNNPLYEKNKYKSLYTFDDFKVTDSFDTLSRDEIQPSLNINEFTKLCINKDFQYVLNILGMGAEGNQYNHTFSYNISKAEEYGPKFPYITGDRLNLIDIEKIDGTEKNYQNDIEVYYENKHIGTQYLKYNHEQIYIKDKDKLSIYGYNGKIFEYFKTNFVSIELIPFKLNLTSSDVKVIDKYFRLLFPYYVIFEPQIKIINNRLEEIKFLIFKDFETYKQIYRILKYDNNNNFKYNGNRYYSNFTYIDKNDITSFGIIEKIVISESTNTAEITFSKNVDLWLFEEDYLRIIGNECDNICKVKTIDKKKVIIYNDDNNKKLYYYIDEPNNSVMYGIKSYKI